MGVDGTDSRIEAWVRDAPEADTRIVIRDIFDEVIDGVVGVCALIDIVWAGLDLQLWPDVYECSLRWPLTADILKREDIAPIVQLFGATDISTIGIGAIRSCAIRSALQ